MAYRPDNAYQATPAADQDLDAESRAPGLIDAIRFLYQRRVQLTFHILAIFTLGVAIFTYAYLTSPKIVEGTVGINFRGIEKSEYPNGKAFTIEDFRTPSILTKALGDAALSTDRISLAELAAHVYVTPVVPTDVQNRWRKQDQAGATKEPYSPNEFEITIGMYGLADKEQLRLFDALVNRYRESVKYDQKLAEGFVYSEENAYDKLAASYDFWDIPDLFRDTYRTINERLASLITESRQYQNATYQLSFRELAQNLDTWERTRLQSLEALTYQGQLVQNRDRVFRRIQYRIEDLQIQVQQKSQQANEAIRLLEAIDRPKSLVAAQLSNKEGTPVIDVAALDKLLRSDYVGPVVERISKLQEEIEAKQGEKSRLEKELSWLPKSSNTSAMFPSGYKDLTATLSRELKSIVQRYDGLLEDYLKATITNYVTLKRVPVISRSVYSPVLVLPGIALFSILLAIVLLGIEHLFLKARQEERGEEAGSKEEHSARQS